MVERFVTAAQIVSAAALFARLGGLGRTWLPSAALLATVVLLLGAAGLVLRRHASGWPLRNDWRRLLDRHGFTTGLALLAGLALLIRLPGIGADLGHVPLNIDEHRLAANVKRFFVSGEIGHGTVEHYPGVLFWGLTGASLLTYLHAVMDGTIVSIRQMPVEMFVLAGRVTNTGIAAGTVVFSGLIGRQLSGRTAGLIAASVVAFAPLSLQVTTVLRNDPAQVLFVCAAVYAAIASYASNRRGWAVLAGALAGIATGIKYTSVFALLPAMLAPVLSGTIPTRLARSGLALLAFVLAVATTNHFLWADFPNFVKQLADQVAITGPGHWAAMDNPAAFHRQILGQFGPGAVMLLLAAGFGVYSLASRRADLWIFWLFPLFYSWFATQRPSQFPRWVYPLVPFVAIAGACALGVLFAAWQASPVRGRRRWAQRLTAPGVGVVAAIALWQPLLQGAAYVSRRLTSPTHEIALQRLRQRSAAGDRVLAERGWLDLQGTMLQVHRVPSLPAVLQGPDYALYAHDWIVVPEPYFGHPGLRRLVFVERVKAVHRAFGGNTGYDFEIYTTPALPSGRQAADVLLADPEASEFLGPEWPASREMGDGLPLPATGASLFLPPRADATSRIELVVVDSAISAAAPLSISAAGGVLPLTEAPSEVQGVRRLSAVVHVKKPTRPTALRLQPADRRRPVRVVRFRFD